ncbi:hypothetical protein BH11PLA1_BH11PLA1_21660 [soil metagenome]
MASDPQEPVKLVDLRTEFEAATVAEALEAQGIRAMVFGGNLAGMRAETPAMASVMVQRADLERALEIFRAVRAESIDIDWEELDVGAVLDPPPPIPDEGSRSPEPSSERGGWLQWPEVIALAVAVVVVLTVFYIMLHRNRV